LRYWGKELSANSGDQARVNALYIDHKQWLFNWLRSRLSCGDTAEDLTQDTFLRLLVSGRLPGAGKGRAFLRQIANGLVIDLHRRQVLERCYLDSLALLPLAEMPSAEHQALVLETLNEIDRMLDSLPERVRSTFLLSQFDGLTYSQIAQRLGVSVASVRKYMLKATLACVVTLGTQSVDEVLR